MPLYWPTEAELEKIERLSAIGLNKGEICAAVFARDRAWWYEQITFGNAQIVNAYANGRAKHAESIMGTLHDVAVRDKNVAALTFLARCSLKRNDKPNIKVDARSVTVTQGQLNTGTKAERIEALKQLTIELQGLIESDTDE